MKKEFKREGTENKKEVKTYGKCKLVKFFYWGLLLISFSLMFIVGPDGAGAVFIVFMIVFCMAVSTLSWTLKIEDDHITIKHGVISTKTTNIKYSKINNMSIDEFLGLWDLEIVQGNDQKIVFKKLDKYEEVYELINQRIEEQDK